MNESEALHCLVDPVYKALTDKRRLDQTQTQQPQRKRERHRLVNGVSVGWLVGGQVSLACHSLHGLQTKFACFGPEREKETKKAGSGIDEMANWTRQPLLLDKPRLASSNKSKVSVCGLQVHTKDE